MRPQRQPYQPNKGTGEVSLSYGEKSGSEFFDDGYNNSNGTVYNTGCIFGSYHYYVTDRLALGMTLGGQSYKYISGYNYNSPGNTARVNLYTAGFELKYSYYDFRYFQFYGLLGVACTYRTENYSAPPENYYGEPVGPRFNLQLTPVGLRFGKNLGGFLELGYGYKGLINTGVYYSFRQNPFKQRGK